ncbi:magnesium transporter NIPA-domain-containing protein [Limtongia smithiae]|uniref:magnesium transporter NIPA-domain-containing protein n=1 Tax=Limtongia smithiae TaxID=1125753 RepID=UPI0034CEB494
MSAPDGDYDTPTAYSATLIGIVTAVCGNILISIALNLQRYAHLRLKREAAAAEAIERGTAPMSPYLEGYDEEAARCIPAELAPRFRRSASDDDVDSGRHGSASVVAALETQVMDYGAVGDTIVQSSASSATGDSFSILGSRMSTVGGGDDVRLQETNADGTEWRHGRSMSEQVSSDSELPRTVTSVSMAESAMTTNEPVDRLPKYMRSQYWWLGIMLMAIGEAGNFLAYGYAPASTVSPLGVVALISNCIVAPLFFHEKFRFRDFLGVVASIAGAVTVVFASNSQEDFLDPPRILAAVSQLSFKIYVMVTVGLIIVLSGLSNKYGDRIIYINIGLVALFGGYTALSTKALSSLLTYTLYRVFTYPITYILVLVLVFTAVMQVKYLSRALQQFESTQVIPTHFVFFTISVIVGSAILYQDFDGASGAKLTRFAFGCLLTFSGVWLITSNRAKQPGEESDDDAEHFKFAQGEGRDEEYFTSIASVNLDRSAGAHTPTSFYEDEEDAHEIGDADALAARRARLNELISGNFSSVPAMSGTTATAPAILESTPLIPAAASSSSTAAISTGEGGTMLAQLLSSGLGTSPSTTSRSYVPGTAGVGLLVDSYVRDQVKTWQRERERRSASGTRSRSRAAANRSRRAARSGVAAGMTAGARRRMQVEATEIDTQSTPLYRAKTAGSSMTTDEER